MPWKHFPHYWPFVRGIHRSPVNSPHKGQWRRALMFSLICAWINSWVNNGEAGDLRHHHAHYDVIVMHSCCVIVVVWNLAGASPAMLPRLQPNFRMTRKLEHRSCHCQLGAAANFGKLIKFGNRCQIRRYQMFVKLTFEFGCNIILCLTQSHGR